MSNELLMIMTSNGTLGDSGRPTGVWVEEVCVPLKAFRDAGFIVSAASPLGGRPPVDPRSAGFDTSTVPDLEAWLDGAGVLADVDPDRYAAVFLVGGHGTMWDFPGNEALARVVGAVASRGVVSAVCHGPAGLIGVAGPGGRPLVAGRTVTAFSDAEEDAAGTRSASPFSLQEELAALGAIVEVAAPFTVNVRRDGNLITGQNPMSSAAVAQAVTHRVRDTRLAMRDAGRRLRRGLRRTASLATFALRLTYCAPRSCWLAAGLRARTCSRPRWSG